MRTHAPWLRLLGISSTPALATAQAPTPGQVGGQSLNPDISAIGELLISPVGYAMIGKLAPRQHQGVMMGAWMLVTGLASLFAGDFSGMLPEPVGSTPQATNPAYASLFGDLGWGSVAVGVALVVLIPVLRRLIKDKDTPKVDELVPAVAPR